MDILLESLKRSVQHLEILDDVFSTFEYPEKDNYLDYRQKIKDLNVASLPPFTDQLYYGDDGRQMILNDIVEYMFSARGYFYLLEDPPIEKQRIFVKIVLYFINQLMILESISVNNILRNKVLDTLKDRIGSPFFANDRSKNIFEALNQFTGDVHFDTANTNIVPADITTSFRLRDSKEALKQFDSFTDSVLPKLPHGVWRELIVYVQLLRINAGHILPLLLTQRVVSRTSKPLKPPDFLVIKENGELVGVEVGGGKETQSSDFSTNLKCQMVTAQNTNIPPRCPICGKWVAFCDKVINDYSDLENPLYYIYDDIRCAHDCDIYSYDQVLLGACPHVKYRGKINIDTKPKQKIKYEGNYEYHYHYSCILKTRDETALRDIALQKQRYEQQLERAGSVDQVMRRWTINCLKTNYPYFDGLKGLENHTRENLSCYTKYLNNKNCLTCKYAIDCKRLSIVIPLIDSHTGAEQTLIEELKRIIPGAP